MDEQKGQLTPNWSGNQVIDTEPSWPFCLSDSFKTSIDCLYHCKD